jgi:hypothetical protein
MSSRRTLAVCTTLLPLLAAALPSRGAAQPIRDLKSPIGKGQVVNKDNKVPDPNAPNAPRCKATGVTPASAEAYDVVRVAGDGLSGCEVVLTQAGTQGEIPPSKVTAISAKAIDVQLQIVLAAGTASIVVRDRTTKVASTVPVEILASKPVIARVSPAAAAPGQNIQVTGTNFRPSSDWKAILRYGNEKVEFAVGQTNERWAGASKEITFPLVVPDIYEGNPVDLYMRNLGRSRVPQTLALSRMGVESIPVPFKVTLTCPTVATYPGFAACMTVHPMAGFCYVGPYKCPLIDGFQTKVFCDDKGCECCANQATPGTKCRDGSNWALTSDMSFEPTKHGCPDGAVPNFCGCFATGPL